MASASVVALSGLWCVFTCPILLDVEIPYYSILLHTVPYNTQWLSSSLLRSWAFGVYLLVPYYSILQPHITPYHTVQYPIAIVNLVALLGFRCVFTCPTLLHITVPYYSILLHAIPYNMQFHTIAKGHCQICGALGPSVCILKKIQNAKTSPHLQIASILRLTLLNYQLCGAVEFSVCVLKNHLHLSPYTVPHYSIYISYYSIEKSISVFLHTLSRIPRCTSHITPSEKKKLSLSSSILCPTLLDSYPILLHNIQVYSHCQLCGALWLSARIIPVQKRTLTHPLKSPPIWLDTTITNYIPYYSILL